METFQGPRRPGVKPWGTDPTTQSREEEGRRALDRHASTLTGVPVTVESRKGTGGTGSSYVSNRRVERNKES